jgi:hypothetical protein
LTDIGSSLANSQKKVSVFADIPDHRKVARLTEGRGDNIREHVRHSDQQEPYGLCGCHRALQLRAGAAGASEPLGAGSRSGR